VCFLQVAVSQTQVLDRTDVTVFIIVIKLDDCITASEQKEADLSSVKLQEECYKFSIKLFLFSCCIDAHQA
jgi:hypothetical protein